MAHKIHHYRKRATGHKHTANNKDVTDFVHRSLVTDRHTHHSGLRPRPPKREPLEIIQAAFITG